jgi:hypothetical protein
MGGRGDNPARISSRLDTGLGVLRPGLPLGGAGGSRRVDPALVLGQEPLELGRYLIGGGHDLALGQQADAQVAADGVLGLDGLGDGVVLLLERADQLADLRGFGDLALDGVVDPVRSLTESSRASAAGG